jgi:hypothetical protein
MNHYFQPFLQYATILSATSNSCIQYKNIVLYGESIEKFNVLMHIFGSENDNASLLQVCHSKNY